MGECESRLFCGAAMFCGAAKERDVLRCSERARVDAQPLHYDAARGQAPPRGHRAPGGGWLFGRHAQSSKRPSRLSRWMRWQSTARVPSLPRVRWSLHVARPSS
eukprot:219626-Prymnesium_polylepis.1